MPSKTQSPGSLRRRKGALPARFTRDWDQSPRKLERVHFPAGGTRRSRKKREGGGGKKERKKETHPRDLKLSASERALRQAWLLQLEVIVPAGVCVVRATARPAPAEGGGGLGEWVTSRGRRQAVWAAEPMNQLSGEGARRAGGGRRNALRAARPRGPAGGASARPRPAPPWAAGPGGARLGSHSARPGCAQPRGLCLLPASPRASALQGGPGAGPGSAREDLLSTHCDSATDSSKKGKQNLVLQKSWTLEVLN